MYSNVTGPQAPRTSGPHQRPANPPYGPRQATGPQRTTGPQRGTGPHQAPPRPPAPPAKQAGPKLVAAAMALAVLGGVGGWLAYDAPAENQYQTVSYAGDNPFTSPVGTDRPGVKPVAAGGEQDGDAPEMYAADPATPACDAKSLVSQLQADPAKAGAWAQVQRIAPDQLQNYVDSLSPVQLRASTAVIDHGYENGSFVPTPAVLAAGTAVFVNSYGQPTVKCFSGNPLTPGQSSDPAVTTVVPTRAAITTNTFTNTVTGGSFSRPGRLDIVNTGPNDNGGDTNDGGEKKGNKKGGENKGGEQTAKPLTGFHNGDGSISLSDGRLILPGGQILPAVAIPDGATRLPDGGFSTKDGQFFNRDGSARTKVKVSNGPPELFLGPNGNFLDAQGGLATAKPGFFVVRNPDGTFSRITNRNDGTVAIRTLDKDGKPVGGVKTLPGQFDQGVNGVRTPPDNKIVNTNGSTRPEKTKLPDNGGELGNDNITTAPPQPAKDQATLALMNSDAATRETFVGPDGQPVDAAVDPATGQKIDPATGQEIDPATGKPTDPTKGQKTDPATGKPVEGAPVEGAPVEGAPVDKAPVAGTNTGVDPVDPPVVEPGPVTKVPGNTGVIVPPVDETAGSTTGTSSGTSTGTSSGTSTGTASGTTSGNSSGNSSGSGSGESASTGGGEGGNG